MIASAAHRAAADGHALADGVAVADLGLGRFAPVLQILRRHADRAEGIEDIARADSRLPVEHHMRDQRALLAEQPRPVQWCKTDRWCRMPGRALPAQRSRWDERSLRRCPGRELLRAFDSCARGTTMQVSVASQASLPSTYALPAILPARVRKLTTSTSMRI